MCVCVYICVCVCVRVRVCVGACVCVVRACMRIRECGIMRVFFRPAVATQGAVTMAETGKGLAANHERPPTPKPTTCAYTHTSHMPPHPPTHPHTHKHTGDAHTNTQTHTHRHTHTHTHTTHDTRHTRHTGSEPSPWLFFQGLVHSGAVQRQAQLVPQGGVGMRFRPFPTRRHPPCAAPQDPRRSPPPTRAQPPSLLKKRGVGARSICLCDGA